MIHAPAPYRIRSLTMRHGMPLSARDTHDPVGVREVRPNEAEDPRLREVLHLVASLVLVAARDPELPDLAAAPAVDRSALGNHHGVLRSEGKLRHPVELLEMSQPREPTIRIELASVCAEVNSNNSRRSTTDVLRYFQALLLAQLLLHAHLCHVEDGDLRPSDHGANRPAPECALNGDSTVPQMLMRLPRRRDRDVELQNFSRIPKLPEVSTLGVPDRMP